ncbi:hypothetical protein G3I60_07165 [Streptomyces sp. SID13666]|uniref:hypothetical protein n=1 Tax=Streptomyces sp. SID13666 TaxID=2706054 RepID=UPI0013C12CB0|nr:MULTISPECIES: hypothetical protein [unclassified Streptomyces]MCZ4097448.1 hypothetical protein [Streptomyces sp. H39-C1]NEA53941.1 hypothetical protein [Streptomyces sp. SID13666]
MTPGTAVAAAAAFVWLGMLLAISFLEAPLKFRAPGVTVPVGLSIGRLVFRALNTVEAVLALTVITAITTTTPPVAVTATAVTVVVLLAVQLTVIRPRLNRRSDRVLAGENLPRSRGHLYYVTLEAAKVIGLTALGISALAAR